MSLFEAWDYDDGTGAGGAGGFSAYDNDSDGDMADDFATLAAAQSIAPPPPAEASMFELHEQYRPVDMKHLAVNNNIVLMGLANLHIIRLDLVNPADLEDMEVAKRKSETDAIHRVFVSPDGHHQIISLNTGDNYYLHSSWHKPRPLTRWKNVVIEAIGWNKHALEERSTHHFIVGTSRGIIYEACVEPKDKSFKPDEKLFRPLYTLPDSPRITGLALESYPNAAGGMNFFIMATTPTRIFQFVGPVLETLFEDYVANPNFFELAGGLPYSDFALFAKHYQALPKSFAWLTFVGLYCGNLSFGSQGAGDSMLVDTTLLPWFEAREDGTPKAPLAMTMTEFHYVFVYHDKYQVVNRLSEEIVFEEGFPHDAGSVLGVTRDARGESFWVFSNSAIWELIVTNEDRHVWKLYLEKGSYELALQYCKTPSQKDKVLTAQADHYFSLNQFELSATFFAKTQKSFEEVALKFITIGERDALKTYLLNKLGTLADTYATQKTIICTWLTELFLNRLNELDATSGAGGGGGGSVAQYRVISEEFHSFLEENTKRLDHPTTFNLIASHGRTDDLLFFAALVEDFERVLTHHIQAQQYEDALAVLRKQSNPEMYYKFSPVLMHHAPKATVSAWEWAAGNLDPRLLIPSLMRYEPANDNSGMHQAIRYLEYCVARLGNTDPAIHNYLLSLYAQSDNDENLFKFIDMPDPCFDLKYALRLCTKLGKTHACIHIYSAMELYEEAVELALEANDLDLAIENARKADDDEDLSRKLWLRIARFVVEQNEGREGDQGIKTAISFINQYGVLKMEDILPFFPDFVLIDHFKEEICVSLENYNRHIEDLKQEMTAATESANLIRRDIKELRNKYGYVGARQKCDLCSFPVLTRPFYLFPCQHVFHCDCFRAEVMESFTAAKRQRVSKLMARLNEAREALAARSAAGPSAEVGGVSASAAAASIERLRADIDAIVAVECVFCGETMIKSTQKPFISPDEQALLKSWEV